MANFVDIRKISFSIQLSDPKEYTGGDLKFFLLDNKYKICPKERGSITFFPSNLFHEVTPITCGKRYSLVSWISGPNLI
jgi:PKHD-type hydroxylase